MSKPITQELEEEFEDQEILLHRFLDNELKPLERLQFLESLDHDPSLRKKLLDMERLLLQTSQLPTLTPSGELKSQVLMQLKPPEAGWLTKLKTVLLTPYVLQWNPAMALVAACVILGLAWNLSEYGWQKSTSEPVAAVNQLQTPVLVRLVLVHPRARSVAVAGDFNSWMPEQTQLRQTEDGIWTVTLQVEPGRYHYMFVVDGAQWVTDPFAAEYSLDGFGAKNAVLDVATSL